MNGGSKDEQAPLRLAPDMASLRLLALAFVRDYIGKWGASPSYGEIAHAVNSNREAVRHAIKALVREGLLLRTPGPRRLALPTTRDAALRVLRELGWSVDEGQEAARSPAAFPGPHQALGMALTDPPLLPPAALDYFAED